MNTIIKTFALILFVAIATISNNAQAQDKKKVTTEFKVLGNCEMCKERIETALDVPGVSFAYWDKETKMLKVTYRTNKVTEEELHALVAKVGHETETNKPTKESYQKLPHCCRYVENNHTH
ncbi:heavy-metal-associated domain-containing protein [Limibacter armeniacum]|uniref:heavy-metal-associated domain-containing protein n=1 Tax=Limibacter armeniacum TaxID=466084 RepID=UPI002FE52659